MYKSYKDVKQAIKSGVSAVEITNFYLKKIEENGHLNAFLEVFESSALEKAKEVDAKIADGNAGRLAGMVIGLKDNICYQDHKVSASSKILENFTSLYSATVVERLLAEDAIVIGRLNCDEFAMGSSNENSSFGPVKNPLNNALVPGGSSGGSAAALAAGLCTATLGSDTGVSIRQPASFTGTYGMKPTYGRISRYGLIAYASSFDQIGPFTNSLEDSALLLEVMAGKDEKDSTSSSKSTEKYIGENSDKKYKIAVLKECFENEGIHPEVKAKMQDCMDSLVKAGHQVELVSFPYMDYMVPTYYVLTTAEASSNLSRFDGVHFGYRSTNAVGVEATYKKSRTEGFGAEVKRRIMAGTFVLSHGYYDAYYTKGQKVRRVLQNRTNEIMDSADIILTPTTPDVAFKQNGVTDPIQMYLQDIFTVHANLTGNPAISLPIGKNKEGLPFGIQVMANHFEEKKMYDFCKELEELMGSENA
ncbi:MAG: Asp-tRNA(Asn)/Glu-tRNA(Gln) amidotransferase subunit GatA [Bacteroidetes bacterium]|nr:Asp-tRNA(Asn)/Glu-tRNA(Gln) amidotransferase subunit GatA [Bacteroidota bacterium]